MLTGLVTAIGLGVDFSGISLLGITQEGLRITIAVTFIMFVALTIWREVEIFLHPRPSVIWESVSYSKTSAWDFDSSGSGSPKPAYSTRLIFRNTAKNPSGDESTAQSLTAEVKILSRQIVVDSWAGIWANNDKAYDYPSTLAMNELHLKANNQPGILDIGFRYEDKAEFYGWDNNVDQRIKESPSRRMAISPGTYELELKIMATNMKKKTWYFSLDVPQSVQSETNHIIIKRK